MFKQFLITLLACLINLLILSASVEAQGPGGVELYAGRLSNPFTRGDPAPGDEKTEPSTSSDKLPVSLSRWLDFSKIMLATR